MRPVGSELVSTKLHRDAQPSPVRAMVASQKQVKRHFYANF
jgi:hypothetical protein